MKKETQEKLGLIAHNILFALKELGELLPRDFETPYAHARRLRGMSYKTYYNSVRQLEGQGDVKLTYKKSSAGKKKVFIQLTPKGNLKVLLTKAKIQKQSRWDGKWRLVIFDIPEQTRTLRNKFRQLLKKNKFYKLQHSVFIHPYPFNREAIEYLKQTGLIKYIRILRVEEMDEDHHLKKIFKLKRQ